MNSAHYRVPRTIIVLLALLALAWGFNWTVSKVVLSEMEPFHFRAWCLSVGSIGLFAIAQLGGHRIRVPRGSWGRLIVITAFNVLLWNITATYGLKLMTSGRAVILAYTFPIWSVLLSMWLLKEPLTRRRVLGLILGMAGMALLLGDEFAAVGRSPLGALLMIASAVSWALGLVIMKRWPVDLPATSITAWQTGIAFGPILLAALLFEDGGLSLSTLSNWSLLGLGYSVFVATVFCYWAWMKVAVAAPVSVSTIGMLMNPVVGVFSGVLVLGEEPRWNDFAALVLVMAAMAVVLLPQRAAPEQRLV